MVERSSVFVVAREAVERVMSGDKMERRGWREVYTWLCLLLL